MWASNLSAGGQLEQPSEVNNSTRTGVAALAESLAAWKLALAGVRSTSGAAKTMAANVHAARIFMGKAAFFQDPTI
jgi:hypothetical protein